LSVLLVFSCSGKKDIDKLNFLTKGNRAYANNDLKEAIRFYDEALAKDSAFVDAWNNKGLALLKQEKYDEAIFCFGRAIQYKPGYAEALLNNARANLAVHQHFAALDNLHQLGKLWPDTSLLPFTAGLVYADMGKEGQALAAFRQSLQLDSTNAETLVNIANIYYHRQQADSALAYSKRALQRDAGQPHAYNVLAMVYAGQEKYAEALQAINRAISFHKNDPYFLNNKGYILLKSGKLPEAEGYIVQSMKIDPYNAWVYRNMGLLRYLQGRYADASRLLAKAGQMDDTIEHIHVDLARAYYATGDTVKACATLALAGDDGEAKKLTKKICK